MTRARATRLPAVVLLSVVALGTLAATEERQDVGRPVPNLAGKILAVTGPIDPSRLGPTLMHEHLFIDFQRTTPRSPFRAATSVGVYNRPLTLEILSDVRMGTSNRDDSFIGDFDETLAEVLEFRNRGGGAIVDVSNIGLGRDPLALMRLARASGLDIVMGAGWYIQDYHPLEMARQTVDELTEIVVKDITVGVDGSGVRSGIIGEVGVGCRVMTEEEIKGVRASARASRITGAPLTFHCGGYRDDKFTILDILESEGVAPTSVVMGHSNGVSNDLEFMKRLLARGVFVEFDYLGAPGSPDGWLDPMDDAKVARGIAALVKAGYADRIVLAHDVCTKIQLKAYGGMGFTYITDHFLPALRALGVPDAALHQIMVDNPRRALTFTAPRPGGQVRK